MLNPYHEQINIEEIIALQRHQYQETLYLEEAVAANSSVDAAVNITALGHFMLLSMTGDFWTQAAGPIDDGIPHLFVQLVDGSNQRTLFDNFIPANLFLSPGRVKSIAGAISADNRSDPLFLEYPFIYTFSLNSNILVRIQNNAAVANTLRIAFKGIRIFPASRQAH
jgi:hypothetical protein